jgi:hypothetical protein
MLIVNRFVVSIMNLSGYFTAKKNRNGLVLRFRRLVFLDTAVSFVIERRL